MGDNRKHNSAAITGDARDKLRKFVTRMEKIDAEIAELQDEKAEGFKDMKSQGYDAPAIRNIIAERKRKRKNPEKFEDLENMKDVVRMALGMI